MVGFAAFPVFKLIVVGMRQVSKPIADVIKTKAKKTPFFRNYICMPPAIFYNFVENNLKIWTMHLRRPAKMPQLSQENAIEMGANLLGELVVFSIASGGLMFEYIRQQEKEREKTEKFNMEHLRLLDDVNDLQTRLDEHQNLLSQILYELEEFQKRNF